MAYQVLARKWRPRNFHEVMGQQHVLQALSNALDQGRLHHAYLFSGTRGVGKTTIARILAKCLNCETGITSRPCGQCSACREIDQGNFVDLLEIDAASRTKVEDTRDLLDNVQYKPARGRFKIYLIDEVHMLSRHSFNALLKTLEEPPEHVKFLLATTDPQKLPVTILSRCLQFHLKALTREQIVEQLQRVLQAEQLTCEPAALSLLAKAAQGSMRDALSLSDQAIAYGNGLLQAETVQQMLGTLDHRQLYQIIGTFTLSAFFTTVNQCFTALTGRPAFTRGVGLNIIMFAHHPFPDQLFTLGALAELLLLLFKQLVHIDAQHLESHGGYIDIRWQPGAGFTIPGAFFRETQNTKPYLFLNKP